MIGTYIKELIKSHNRVIVPDLGAFLRKNDNPDQLYFNEFLRFNDGLLVDYLSEKEGVDKIEAAKRIKKLVADINKNLTEKQPVELKGIGTLYMDNTDKIQLKIDLLKAYIPEEKTVPEKTKTKNIKDTPVIKEVFEEPVVKPQPIIEKQEPDAVITSEPIVEKQKTEPIIIPQPIVEKQKIVPPPVIEKKEEKPIEEKPKIEEKTISEKKAPLPEKPIKIESKPLENGSPEVKSSGNSLTWLLVVIVLLILFLVWFFVIKPKYNKASNQNNIVITESPAETSAPPSKISSKKVESEKKIDEKVIVKNKPAETNITLSKHDNKMYYLVVGCFAMENNANNFIRNLKEKGFNAEKIAKIDHVFLVSIASFPDLVSAQSEMVKIKSQGYDCWIKHY
jgi:cell division septation protein DedD/nucleoid DNA-binding protein